MRSRPLVLLVDDDTDTREITRGASSRVALTFCRRDPRRAGFTLAEERAPDVVVTDFTLPGEDGFVLAERVRAHAVLGDTSMFLVSGRSFGADSGERAVRLFDGVLLKPVLPDQLIAEMVPLMLDRTSARLQRQLTDVRARSVACPIRAMSAASSPR